MLAGPEEMEKMTGRAELAVASKGIFVSPTVWLASAPKVMVWLVLARKFTSTVCAAWILERIKLVPPV